MEMILIEDCCEILDSKRIPITAKNRTPGPYPYYGANGIQDYVDICEERTPDAGRLTADGNRRGTAKLEWPPGRIVKLV